MKDKIEIADALERNTFEVIRFLRSKGELNPLEAMGALMLAAATIAVANELEREVFQAGADACWKDALEWGYKFEELH